MEKSILAVPLSKIPGQRLILALLLLATFTLAVAVATGASGPAISISSPAQSADRTWEVQVVNSAGDGGKFTSLALDRSGNPHISYMDDYYALEYASRVGNKWVVQTVDSSAGGAVGTYTSLVLDSSDNPHISYVSHPYGMPDFQIKYARWVSGAWDTRIVDSGPNPIGMIGTSLVLDRSDIPHISYFDPSHSALKYARWVTNTWVIQTVDSVGTGDDWHPSLVLDHLNNPHISYYDGYSGILKYADWAGGAWVAQTVDSAVGQGNYTSLALDSLGNPHIAYRSNADLRYARRLDGAWVVQAVSRGIGPARYGGHLSLTLDGLDNPHISFYDNAAQDLKHARWTGVAWIVQTVDSSGSVGGWNSLIVDRFANPHISYYDRTDSVLRYAVGGPPSGYIFVPESLVGGVEPGGQAIYTHTLQNTGNISDTYWLEWSSLQNWATVSCAVVSGTIALPGTATLQPGQTVIVTVTVSVPTGTALVDVADKTIVTATSSISPTLVRRVTDVTFVPRARVYLPILLNN